MNYFAIERNERCWEDIVIKDQNGNVIFDDYINLTYDEMKSREDLDEFVISVMEATNAVDNSYDEQTAVTLIREDGVFIWGIFIGKGDKDGDLNYVLMDWQKDGKKYRYAP